MFETRYARNRYTRDQSLFSRTLRAPIVITKGVFMITVGIASLVVLSISLAIAATATAAAYAAYQITKPLVQLVTPVISNLFGMIRPAIDGFYYGVRLALTPLKKFNDRLEAFMINNIAAQRISPTNARRIVMAIYAAELIVGSTLMGAIIAPAVTFLMPSTAILSSVFIYSAMLSFNILKLSSWMAERWTNFSASVRNLQWREDWMNARATAEMMFVRHRERDRHRALYQQLPGNFAVEWQKAMDTRDLSQVLRLLQGSYELDGKVTFTPEMTASFDENRYGTNFYGVGIADDSEDLCCPLSGSIMQIPVYVVATNGVKNYFDFIQLLKALETKNKNPLNRETITNLNEIKYDAEMYNRIHGLLNNPPPAPVLLSGGLEASGNGFNVVEGRLGADGPDVADSPTASGHAYNPGYSS